MWKTRKGIFLKKGKKKENEKADEWQFAFFAIFFVGFSVKKNRFCIAFFTNIQKILREQGKKGKNGLNKGIFSRQKTAF